uniref:Syndetin C-terminal domain-containing protein n=1 Tax=Meloidogyne incognita TaxID=6306 RepID=A0A914NN81_MELIC
MIWSMMSMCTVRLLVRGYSESNKCSNEGRALQLMDVEHLFKKLEELIGLRPFPHRLFVENYVKAFFLPSDELNEWIVRHTEYTLSQTGALLNASISNAPSATKKAVTMSRIMVNLLDASGISDGSNSFFH